MKKIFIDGSAGTTGLRIYERLQERNDITLLTLSGDDRKNPERRAEMLNNCDVAFLCLPDEAAKEAVSMIENEDVVVLDTSTAHRTNPEWTYGFPELIGREKIANAKRIAVPGCHASGFISLVNPLVKNEIISPKTLLTCHSITGYSGGGKKMIAQYETEKSDDLLAPRQYGLTQQHKHLREMKALTGIENLPIFCPIVSDFYSGMVVTVPLFASDVLDGKSIIDIVSTYKRTYNGEVVKYVDTIDENGFISANILSGKDGMQISALGNEERILLVARYDNLGKGASGAAIQCLNIVLGVDETKGLVL